MQFLNLTPDVVQLIADIGVALVLKRVTGGTYVPSTGKNTPTSANLNFKGLILKYRDSQIDGTMIKRGDRRMVLDAAGAAKLRAVGEDAEVESIDIYQFTKAIRTVIPIEDRIAIVEALWKVVLADGARDPHEDTLMRQLVDRLGLSPMDSALARQRVQGGGSIQA